MLLVIDSDLTGLFCLHVSLHIKHNKEAIKRVGRAE